MALSERLRKLRKEQGLSQEAVARRADIGLRAYGELERGIAKDPHLTTLEGIASALGTTVAELVGEESEVSAAGKASAPPETGPEERRSKLEEARRAAHYIIERADWYEQELEGERAHWYNRIDRADRAYVLAVQAIEEFSSFHRHFFNEVARDLVREIENGNAPELVDEFDSLEEAFMERIARTQRMLLANAKHLAETQDWGEEVVASLQEASDANIKSGRESA